MASIRHERMPSVSWDLTIAETTDGRSPASTAPAVSVRAAFIR